LLVFATARAGYDHLFESAPSDGAPLETGDALVASVEPSGTLIVRQPADAGREREFAVRLLGVKFPADAPPRAAEILRSRLQSRRVRVELDLRRIDRAGRFLAYLYHDGVLINELVVSEGWAAAENYPGDAPTVTRRLRSAEQDARDNARGIWAARFSAEESRSAL
jgi:endonuclease YncB( thermonuclease family)